VSESVFILRLYETIHWCKNRVDLRFPESCLRSALFVPILASHAARWDALCLSSRMIEDLAQTRRRNMVPNVGELPGLLNGRILLCAYEYTNHNEAALAATDGYFDGDDVPPWDSWIAEVVSRVHSDAGIAWHDASKPDVSTVIECRQPAHALLAAWVPDPFIPLVQLGMEAECMGMLSWIEPVSENLGTGPRFAEVIPAWLKKLAFDLRVC